MPTFSAPLDCTPWVIGGIWPPGLSPPSAETATLAEYLKVDLQRIARTANEDLRAIGRGAVAYPARRAAEARVINEARALAVRRVESTMRQLRQMVQRSPIQRITPDAGRATVRGNGRADMDKTQVIPAVRDAPPAFDLDKAQVIPVVRDETPVIEHVPVISDHPEAPPAESADLEAEAKDSGRHRLL